MWTFSSPEIVFGDDALCTLERLTGRRALIVTDPVLDRLGFSQRVAAYLHKAGMETRVFAEVEPEPSVQTVRRGSQVALEFEPDWIVGLGGGSAMDAAKAILALYEHPELDPFEISPLIDLNIHKAQLIAIPTTSGTGSEATWAVVLTDPEEQRKFSTGSRELVPRYAILDPELTRDLPARITADTGLDALTHAIEGYTSTWRNDFSDGLCLNACRLIFAYLERAVTNGPSDKEARERMANAAAIAGLGFGNSNAALAHAMGHSFGGLFKQPHGRTVALFLPYTMEFTILGGAGRYTDIARLVGLPCDDEETAGRALVERVRALERAVGQPTSIAELGIGEADFREAMERLCDHAENDTQILAAPRIPERDELERLFAYAYAGRPVDF
jgi:alcohol dehydrogenase class IV